ncbi:uncharacterized protein HKBW3S09_01478 [Candidatus Hakubella thermalkaliphila]|uniref:Cyclophilin TM1367-like domain-containing protein n=1 Tax=Candidatus Hakubella thermalkaliphila TaxID=2754717 RepID=A0A6V8NUR4_9ACTN|nr:uncharacterized protein HKBW3S09_01478 [Candidatus Hakubella thermalkaliphila]
MPKKIRIRAGNVEDEALLNDSRTDQAIWDALPIEGSGSKWGEEIYFPIPVQAELEDGQEEVEVGTLGYWPPGSALCIFFGPTPVSQSDQPRAASPVTLVGEVSGDAKIFQEVSSGTKIIVEKAE